ncbi:DegV family protein [Deinococcus sp.]|uniref:DegV family protein n=1 Tax=Deinococcus sp. TaxID=47478 RepID=UPI0025BCF699|nr:DegV family protein [Deinococcus sp.]
MSIIVTDSTCDLPPAQAKSLGIEVIPLTVNMRGKQLLDWQEVDPDAVYEFQKSGGKVTTQPPTTEQFVGMYSSLLEKHDRILSVHISSAISETVQRSREAVAKLGASDRITTLDSKMTCAALAETLFFANEVLKSGGSVSDAVKAVNHVQSNGRFEFSMPTLHYLRQSGRISRGQEIMGNLLNLRPVLNFNQGNLTPVRRVRNDQALANMISRLEDDLGNTPVSVVVAYAGRDVVQLEAMRSAIQRSRLNVVRGRFQLIGAVIGAHAGPGMYGVGATPV